MHPKIRIMTIRMLEKLEKDPALAQILKLEAITK